MNKNGARTGLLLAALGGLTISFDVPTIRLSQADAYMAMVVRGAGIAITLGLIGLFARRFLDMPPRPLRDRDFLTVGFTYGISNIFFTIAVFNTSTANLLFILAFMPMIAALLGWALIGERPSGATWAAISITIAGVGVIVWEGLSRGSGFGEIMSLATAFMVAYAIVRTRKSGKDLSLSPAIGGALTALAAFPIMVLNWRWPGAPLWLVIDGFIIIPIASFLLALAPRYIRAARVAMFYLLETVLAPLWVWIIFSEMPSQLTYLGGALILGTIIAHSIWQLRRTSSQSPLTGKVKSP